MNSLYRILINVVFERKENRLQTMPPLVVSNLLGGGFKCFFFFTPTGGNDLI